MGPSILFYFHNINLFFVTCVVEGLSFSSYDVPLIISKWFFTKIFPSTKDIFQGFYKRMWSCTCIFLSFFYFPLGKILGHLRCYVLYIYVYSPTQYKHKENNELQLLRSSTRLKSVAYSWGHYRVPHHWSMIDIVNVPPKGPRVFKNQI